MLKSTSIELKKCTFCAYKSARSYNVVRHEDRIHRPKNCRVFDCCNKRFLTKGDYYGHVEDQHPHTRKGFVSRIKYQIIKSNLKAYKLKKEQAKQKIQKRTHQVKSIPIVEPKRSLRIQQMKLQAINSMKKESEIQKITSEALEKSDQPPIQHSLKRKFKEITDKFDDNLISAKSFNDLPLKKRILRKLEENVVLPTPMIPVPLKPKNNEKFQENIAPEVSIIVKLDPNILWPESQHLIAEYLSDIKFEFFKILDQHYN